MSSAPSERPGWRFSLRLAQGVAGFFAAVVVGIYFVSGALLERALVREEAALVLDRQEDIRLAWEAAGEDGLQDLLGELVTTTGEQLAVRVTGADRKLLFSGATANSPAVPWTELEAAPPDSSRVTAAGGWVATTEVIESGEQLHTARFSGVANEVRTTYRGLFLSRVAPLLAAGLAVGAGLVYLALRPLRRTVKVMRHIVRTGDWAARVQPPRSRGEMRDLAESFNAVLERQHRLVESLRQSLDSVAHDLRTPLTRLQAAAESGLGQAERTSAAHEALTDCLEEAQRVKATLDTLLDVAEAEAGAIRLRLEPVQPAALLAEVAELYEFTAEEKGARIVVGDCPPGEFLGDRVRLRRAVANLVDNALKYLGEGRLVTLSAKNTGPGIVLQVKDDGIGISAEDLPRIWDRLFRSDRSRSAPGMGLGLSLVRAIIEAHGGKVEATSRPGQGSLFRLHLPRLPGRAGASLPQG
jgi:signal transduction histidine kinase